MRTPTIRDVAHRAGVGVGTVSRMVNGGQHVSPRTQARVQAAIDELGFRPSRRGQAFARGRTSSVVVLVPFVTHPSPVERVSGLIHGLRASALPLSVADVERPEHQREHLTSLVDDLRPEGLVIISLRLSDADLAALAAAQVRPVLIDTEAPGLSSLVTDDLHGGRIATDHLVALGHRRIGFVGDVERDLFGFTSSERRHSGYVDALRAAGIDRDPDLERTGRHSQDNARGQAAALFALPDPPTAVFAASDTQALGVLQAARERRLRVPEDVSVVGFDDIAVAELVGLTTVRQPLVESGKRAAAIVLEQVADPGRAAERIELPLELIARSSTGPPPAATPTGS
jgi:DNA-binding LacI/PurR family transcriptional regulator